MRRLWIPGPEGRLEATLRSARAPRAAAVVAHPHPLHGGTLHNPVVFHADRELHRAGLTTLRFNFRGVGESEGRHDDGRGEVADVEAAATWLRGLARDAPLILVGYSFGFWCSLRLAAEKGAVDGLVGIGMPASIYGFDELSRLACPLAVVQGSQDELGSPDAVRRLLGACGSAARLYVIDGAGHRFTDAARDAAGAVVRAVGEMLAEP